MHEVVGFFQNDFLWQVQDHADTNNDKFNAIVDWDIVSSLVIISYWLVGGYQILVNQLTTPSIFQNEISQMLAVHEDMEVTERKI